MSARDDYPHPDVFDADVARSQRARMCDEIDKLRAGSEHAAICVPIEKAKDELIRELTKHADAMRDLLNEAMSAADDERPPRHYTAERYQAAITAYDRFIKEA